MLSGPAGLYQVHAHQTVFVRQRIYNVHALLSV